MKTLLSFVFILICTSQLISLNQAHSIKCIVKKNPNISYMYKQNFSECIDGENLVGQYESIIIEAQNSGLDLDLGQISTFLAQNSKNLRFLALDLSGNGLAAADIEKFSKEVGQLENLENLLLEFGNNQIENLGFLEEMLPQNLENLVLDFQNNRFGFGGGLKGFENLEKLNSFQLVLASNQVEIEEFFGFFEVFQGMKGLETLEIDISHNKIGDLGSFLQAFEAESLGNLVKFQLDMRNIDFLEMGEGDGEDGENQQTQKLAHILDKMGKLEIVYLKFDYSNFLGNFEDLADLFAVVGGNVKQVNLSLNDLYLDSFEFLAQSLGQLKKQVKKLSVLANNSIDKKVEKFEKIVEVIKNSQFTLEKIILQVQNSLADGTDLGEIFDQIGNYKQLQHLELNFGYTRDLKGFDKLSQSMKKLENVSDFEFYCKQCFQIEFENLAESIYNWLNQKSQVKTMALDLSETLRQVLTDNSAQKYADQFFGKAFQVQNSNLETLSIDFSHNTRVENYRFLGKAFEKLEDLKQFKLVIQNSILGDISQVAEILSKQDELFQLTIDFSHSIAESLEPLGQIVKNLGNLSQLELSLGYMGLQDLEFLRFALQNKEFFGTFVLQAEFNNVKSLGFLREAFAGSYNLRNFNLNLLGNVGIEDLSPLANCLQNVESFSELNLNLAYQNEDQIDYSPLNQLLYKLYENEVEFTFSGGLISPDEEGISQNYYQQQNTLIKTYFQKNQQQKRVANGQQSKNTYYLGNLVKLQKRFLFKKGEIQLQECDQMDYSCADCSQKIGENCENCLGNLQPSECSVCADGYFQKNEQCLTCNTVIGQCSECQNGFTCSSCFEGYELNEFNFCQQKNSEIQNCLYMNEEGSSCLQCSTGYQLTQESGNKIQVCQKQECSVQSLEGCSFCPLYSQSENDEKNKCLECSSNYNLMENGECQKNEEDEDEDEDGEYVEDDDNKSHYIVIIILGSLFVLCMIAAIIYSCYLKKKKLKQNQMTEYEDDENLRCSLQGGNSNRESNVSE
ncbi:Insulin-like growth factor binding protein, N-terminal [Pseudocohnilembus persalinus]|uniref:Insulin-like growth factor binding protein, N-terminal n=1 Tax=Pseudocohnilembus persalinus TaxID=266149 RepID=A0A0V0QA41_PSEPJ|nr:Insulin-like growth factor binding protein, N-terminal [Pseudocohnilembus persalinus]|eukprot:KRW99101.1 Insulin-like growth factor binding protein, N-terminal [Pseudocohnilembus persalinus]